MTAESLTPTDVLSIPFLRVSCSGLARIEDPNGNFVLITNKSRMRAGKTVLTPIGGVLGLTEVGRVELKALLKIDGFEKDDDMRFMMRGSSANDLVKWFCERRERELDPLREVREELVDELPYLLSGEELEGVTSETAGYYWNVAQTTKLGQEGKLTLYLSEISNVVLPQASMERLVTAAQVENPWVCLVTPDEIRASVTEGGIEVGSITRGLISTSPQLPEFK